MTDDMMTNKTQVNSEATRGPAENPGAQSPVKDDSTSLALNDASGEISSHSLDLHDPAFSLTVGTSSGPDTTGAVPIDISEQGSATISASTPSDSDQMINSMLDSLGILKRQTPPEEKFQIRTSSSFEPEKLDSRWQANIEFIIDRMNEGENAFFMTARAGSGKSLQCYQLAEELQKTGGLTYMSLGQMVRNGLDEMSSLQGRDRNGILYDSFTQLKELRDYLKQEQLTQSEEPLPSALIIIDEASLLGIDKMDFYQQQAIEILQELKNLGANFVLIGHPSTTHPDLTQAHMSSWMEVVNRDPRADGSFINVTPRTATNNPDLNTSTFEMRSKEGPIINGPFEIPEMK